MQKVLLIAALIGILLYFITRKIVMKGNAVVAERKQQQGYICIESGSQILNKIIKSTVSTAAFGLILFLLILFLAMKVKILLILLPISIYLMSQLLLLNNQLKYAKNQQVWYNPSNNEVILEWASGNKLQFNLLRDIQAIKEVKAVQKNKDILFGYYALTIHNNQIYLPLVLEANPLNKGFFKTLKDNYEIKSNSSLYPII